MDVFEGARNRRRRATGELVMVMTVRSWCTCGLSVLGGLEDFVGYMQTTVNFSIGESRSGRSEGRWRMAAWQPIDLVVSFKKI